MLPFAMLPVLHFAAQREVMGRFVSSPTLFAVSSCLAILVMAINVMFVVSAHAGERAPRERARTGAPTCTCTYTT